MNWHVLSVVPHSTLRVCERAAELGFETYNPMLRTIEASRNGRKPPAEISKPLFVGYAFVRFSEDSRGFDIFHRAFDYSSQHDGSGIDGCLGLLSTSEGPSAVSDAVIQDLREREARGEFDLNVISDDGRFSVPKWAKTGKTVEFVEGPFKLFFGVIEKVVGPKLIEVSVSVFGRLSVVICSLDWIKRVA